MYTDPQIISTENLRKRAYIKFYVAGERYRYYNGKPIGISCNPNNAATVKERDRALTTLRYSIKKMLDAGWLPNKKNEFEKTPQKSKCYIGDQLVILLKELLQQDLSRLYKIDIALVGNSFLEYLNKNHLYDTEVSKVDSILIEKFLKSYNHSATYYMNKRRTLGGIFSRLVTQKIITTNPFLGS